MKIHARRLTALGRRQAGAQLATLLVALFLTGCRPDRSSEQLPIGNLDTPAPGVVATDVIRISGWALAKSSISRIDVYIDGKFLHSGDVGVTRPDVQQAYPKYQDALNSGFDFQVSLGSVAPGNHILTVQARSSDDSVKELASIPVIVNR